MTLYCSPGQVDHISENSRMDSACGGPAFMPKSSQPVDSVQSSFTLRACSSSVCVHFSKQMLQPLCIRNHRLSFLQPFCIRNQFSGNLSCSPACDPSLGHMHIVPKS